MARSHSTLHNKNVSFSDLAKHVLVKIAYQVQAQTVYPYQLISYVVMAWSITTVLMIDAIAALFIRRLAMSAQEAWPILTANPSSSTRQGRLSPGDEFELSKPIGPGLGRPESR